MSEEQLEYDPEWTLATLNDAKEALEDLIAQVEDSPEEVKEILEENIANVYAKLNYAFNSAKDGPDALLSMPDDDNGCGFLPFAISWIDSLLAY